MNDFLKLKIACTTLVCANKNKSKEYILEKIMQICKVDSDTVSEYFNLSEEEQNEYLLKADDFLDFCDQMLVLNFE